MSPADDGGGPQSSGWMQVGRGMHSGLLDSGFVISLGLCSSPPLPRTSLCGSYAQALITCVNLERFGLSLNNDPPEEASVSTTSEAGPADQMCGRRSQPSVRGDEVIHDTQSLAVGSSSSAQSHQPRQPAEELRLDSLLGRVLTRELHSQV